MPDGATQHALSPTVLRERVREAGASISPALWPDAVEVIVAAIVGAEA